MTSLNIALQTARRAASRKLPRLLSLGLFLAAGALSSGLAHADAMGGPPENFEDDFETQAKSWQELSVSMPAPFAETDLVPFYVDPRATSTSAIDAKSLSVGSDGVIRYTLVTRTEGGAVNVSYDGIRCGTYEHKSYAFGRPDGSWGRSRRDQWTRVKDVGANRQDAALYYDYFCNDKIVAGNAQTIVQRMRAKRPLDYNRNGDEFVGRQ